MSTLIFGTNTNDKRRFSYTLIYGFYGALFGLFFPILGTGFDLLFIQHKSITWDNIILAQMQLPLHWIIDTAPFFLGLFASIAGKKQDHLVLINEELESKVRERTLSLEEKNKLLSNEIEERIAIEKALVVAKEEAIRAKNAEEAFLANMSHEIRTPINGIVGFTELLSQSTLTDEQQEFMDSIKHSTSHLMAIINDILDMSKIKAGHIEFEEIEIDIRELIGNITNTLKIGATAKSLILVDEVDPDVPKVIVGDAVRLSQVLYNLVNNAIKFTHQGHVKIIVRSFGESKNDLILGFEVEDTGIGIASNQLHKIFQDFTQAESDTTRKYGGTGLGLSISKKLVELQGGAINVESELNKGSVFSFTIPFKKPEQEHKTKKEIEQPTTSIPEGCKVLIVDDNRMNRVLATKVLQKGARQVFIDTAENGLEAIRLLREKDFDIILLDLQMPIMDGYETCKYIRTKFIQSKRNIPIMALTADALASEKIKAFSIGMNDYVVKPFRGEELYRKFNLLVKNNQEAPI
ncbi:MAG: response regulator [Saprospiraceae bacterium]|nr:response regulator [Saprospiraceae bacterium]